MASLVNFENDFWFVFPPLSYPCSFHSSVLTFPISDTFLSRKASNPTTASIPAVQEVPSARKTSGRARWLSLLIPNSALLIRMQSFSWLGSNDYLSPCHAELKPIGLAVASSPRPTFSPCRPSKASSIHLPRLRPNIGLKHNPRPKARENTAQSPVAVRSLPGPLPVSYPLPFLFSSLLMSSRLP
ncbi:hypothetical protein GALMADRAFT_916167 [Galerina marginata CBS 339.88]|uniref:Uncharacterized protein n=1 Tax=Galerina marginata (strain CBS 339.88) TaxID=685588 RepID=A0A067SF95_GALM3|nr:hypothetical protein GALMADRAFT_916167 [Galerina marginata CBS 339.88]